MTDRDQEQPDDEQDIGDWLASRFARAEEPPTPQQPPTPQPPIAPPRFDNPFPGVPPVSNPYVQNPQPPVPPVPPVPPAPAAPPPPAPAQGGFSWGLTPGAATPPPAAPVPPAAPSAPVAHPAAPAPASQPPVVPPPAPQPPAATTPPGAWFEPVPQHPDPVPLDPAIAGNPPEAQPPAEPMPFETTVLPDVAPDARDAPAFWEPEPTQLMDAVELDHEPAPEPAPKQPFTRSVFPEGTELLPEQPAGETAAMSGLDSLFGESQFREYSDRPDPSENPFLRRAEQAADPGNSGGPGGAKPPAEISTLQKTLLWVLGSLLAVIALIALFFLGTRLPDLLGPSPAIVPSASPSPSASAAAELGPVEPGTYRWDELLGGECIDPYDSPFQDEYTVVECTVPHAAQMVRTGTIVPVAPVTGVFDPDAYPGEQALQEQTLGLCRASGIFSPAASAFTDAQITASYPTEQQWTDGNRAYYCFVTRSSGEPLTADIALPQVAPTPAEPVDPAAP